MLLSNITEQEILFMESWYQPRCLAENLFSDLDNFGRFDKTDISSLRLYQLSMISDEPLIDFKATAKYHNLSKNEEFNLRKNIGDIYNFGGRLTGKSLCSLKLDIVLSALYEKGLKSALWSIDERRLRGILDSVQQAFDYHPFFKIWNFICSFKPEIKLYGKKNYWSLKGVNLTLQGKNPGQAWYQMHVSKMFGEEVSFETDEVFKKRRDSVGELGAVHRQAGMTNFTRQQPAGKAFYDPKNKNKVLNLPRFANPFWSKDDLEDAVKEFGGKESFNFKVFVEGKVIEDGVSEIDIDRIKDCYLTKKSIKRFEINKKQYKQFENLIVVERPKNSERIFICSDVGDNETDITIFSEVNEKYSYIYNIILYNLIKDEQEEIFKFLIEKLEANVIAIDCGDAFGRILCDDFEKLYSKDNVFRYAGASKIDIGLEKDADGKVIVKNGKPVCRREYMSEWSVNRLKVLLYENRLILPVDYKFQSQINSIISTTSRTRKTYNCISETGDHLFSSFRVFTCAQWARGDFNKTASMKQEWSSGVNSWD